MSTDVVQAVRQANAMHAPRSNGNERKVIKKLDPAQRRIIGFGQQPDVARIRNGEGATQQERLLSGLGACGIIDAIRESANAPVWNMDIVEQVRWNLAGPLSQQAVLQGFDAGEINIFGNINVPPGVSVESTLVQPGQTQTYMVACYLGVHMEPDPLCFTAHGNAWTAPASATGAVPLSPDVFTQADAATLLGSNALGLPAGTTMTSAYLEWGWWANYASWNMVRGYNLKWKIGQRTNIMDDVLRHTAYMPPNGQEGSASNSMVDVTNFVNRVNTYYTSPTTLASPLIFLKENAARVGSIQTTPGNPATNAGVFLPSRAGQLVPATYGGMDLRSMLKGNSEFRKLTLPYLIKPGVPIGLVFEGNQDQFAITQMQNYIDAQQGFATLPPIFTDAANISNSSFSGTGITPAGIEVPLNQAIPTSTYNFNEVNNATTLFKGGNFKIAVMIRGFEVSEDWYQMMCADPIIRETVMNACGIHIAQLGA